MFGSISRLIFGDYQVSEEVTAPGSLAAVNEDLDFDTRSEDGEWVLITRGWDVCRQFVAIRSK